MVSLSPSCSLRVLSPSCSQFIALCVMWMSILHYIFFCVNIVKTSPSSTNPRARLGLLALARFAEDRTAQLDPIYGIRSIPEVYIRDYVKS